MKTNEIDFKKIIDRAPWAILILDYSFRIRFSNERFNELLNFEKDQIIEQNADFLFNEDSVSLIKQLIYDKTSENVICNESGNIEVNINFGNGSSLNSVISYCHIETFNNKWLLISIPEDVNQTGNERTTKKPDEWFHTLLDIAPDAIFLVDKEGIIEYTNLQGIEIFGYSLSEILGQKIEMLIPKNFSNHHLLRDKYFDSPKVRTMGVGLELSGIKKSGELFPVAISLSPFQDADSMKVIATVRDITHKKIAENEIKKLNSELRALDQAKTSFLQIISHELRTPLHGIIGITNLLAEKTEIPELLNYIDYLKKLNERLENFTNNALIITKLRLRQYEYAIVNFSLIDAINHSLNHNYEQTQTKDISFHIDVIDKLTLKSDKDLVNICIINILGNAIKYSPLGGNITIRAEESEAEIKLEITDQGAGFSEESLLNQFKLFSNDTNHFDENIGLGLSLCKMIMDCLSGKIEIGNNSSSGAFVYLYLPKDNTPEGLI